MIPFLIVIPAVMALIFPFVRARGQEGHRMPVPGHYAHNSRIYCPLDRGGAQVLMLYPETELVDHLMSAGISF